MVARLQHPHILPVFDFGDTDGYTYIVMPWVSGGTLAARMSRGRVPWDEITRLVSQLGDALDYAHRLGLIHRDVKPSNVLIDEQGNCLLTDFGIAKLAESSARFTNTGGTVGTPTYMSPEQGRGLPVDGRTDVYALGVILFEMVVGRVPYQAETPIAVVFKHIQDPLPMPRSLRPDVPEAIERVILRALAKDPDDRFATAGDLVAALRAALTNPPVDFPPANQSQVQPAAIPSASFPAPLIPRAGLRLQWLIGLAGVGGLVILVGVFLWGRSGMPAAELTTPSAEAHSLRPTLSPLEGGAVGAGLSPSPTATATPPATLPPPSLTMTPSPTATLVPASPTPIGGGRGFAFNSTREGNLEIYVTDANGRTTNVTHNPAADWLPAWSPDGARLAFVSDRDGNEEIYVMRADGSELTRLTDNPAKDEAPVWSPDGQFLAFQSDRSGIACLYRLAVDGTGVELLVSDPSGAFQPAWSPDGTQLLYQSKRDGDWDLYRLTLFSNDILNLTKNVYVDVSGSWSPDGRRIVFSSNRDSNHYEIYSMASNGSEVSRLTQGDTNSWTPAWSAEGQWIVYSRKADDNYELYRMRADGTENTRLTESSVHDQEPAWRP